MKKKFLFIANSSKPTKEEYLSRDKVVLNNFSIPNIEAALKMGYEVYMGINRKYADELTCDYPIKFYDANIFRSIYNIKDNLKAYRNLNFFLKNHKIDVIHCNTPIGGFLGRICGSKSKVPTIIYTVHGFHFYKGAPILYNTVFKGIERRLAKKTDILITINEEDYLNSKKFKLKKNGLVYKVNGVGIDIRFFGGLKSSNTYLNKILNIDNDSIIMVTTGDLVRNKNHKVVLKAINALKNNKLHFVICGKGPELDRLKKISKKFMIENQVHFLGYRSDIKEILSSADIFLLLSHREGLPRSLMEAMALGLPVIVSNIRGNVDLIKNGEGGYLCKPNNYKCIGKAINNIIENGKNKDKMIKNNLLSIQKFDVEVIKKRISEIYQNI